MFSNIFVFFLGMLKKKLEYIWYEKNTKTKYIFLCNVKNIQEFVVFFFLVILAMRFKKKEFF